MTAIDHQLLSVLFREISPNTMGKDSRSVAYYYFNNPDGTIRFVQPASLHIPYFLHLYSGSGWRGFLVRSYYSILFMIGLGGWISDGTFYGREPSLSLSEYWALFTGTVGLDRKFVIATGERTSPTRFLKVPITEASARLTTNECTILDKLSKLSFKSLEYPAVTALPDHIIAVSNIRKSTAKTSAVLQHVHIEALAELQGHTTKKAQVQSLKSWQFIETQLRHLADYQPTNDIDLNKYHKLVTLLQESYKFWSTNQQVLHITLAHGDFTPWNQFIHEHFIAVIDWELAQEQPALFDFFHFHFQSGILIKHSSYQQIIEGIRQSLRHPASASLTANIQQKISLYYAYYLLYIVSYYLAKYSSQANLHEQVDWLMDVWLEALREHKNVDFYS